MVFGMARTRKVTVTLPTESVDAIKALVASGKADSMSGFVQHAVKISLEDVAGWGEILAQALRATGGDLTDDERAWADAILGGPAEAGGS